MTPEELKTITDELKNHIGSLIAVSGTTQGGGSSASSTDIKDLKDKTEKTDTLVRVGFYVVIIMVATIIISLEMWFIGGNNQNLEKIYDFENNNINTFSGQQTQLNALQNQIKIFKNCIKNGYWNSCFNQ